jgi:sugar phosphate isomerase/epimerase
MLTGSDKARLELDLGWVAAAGHDPAAMIKKYKGRVDLLHIKDMVKDGDSYRSVELGKGIVKWKPAFEAAKAEGVKSFFVEQEEPYVRPIFESLAISIAHLKTL